MKNTCNPSDRMIAMNTAHEILSRYGEYTELSPEMYLTEVLSLAESLVEWSEGTDRELITPTF